MTPRHTGMTRGRPGSGAVLAILRLFAGGCGAKDAAPGVTMTLRSASIPRPGGEPMAAYDEGTAARAVVMSHGGSGTKENFVGIAAAFAVAGWRVVAYDAGTDRRSDLRDVVSYARGSGAAEDNAPVDDTTGRSPLRPGSSQSSSRGHGTAAGCSGTIPSW